MMRLPPCSTRTDTLFPYTTRFRSTMPPLIFEDLVLIGPGVSEMGLVGWVGACRLSDGDSVWRFNLAALSDTASWRVPAGIHVAGGAVWTPMTLEDRKSTRLNSSH